MNKKINPTYSDRLLLSYSSLLVQVSYFCNLFTRIKSEEIKLN